MPADTARASLASLAILRPQVRTETFEIEDDEEEEGEDEEEQSSTSGRARSSARLSAMFEHNDLINNRIAGLAQSIRQRNMPMPRRLSVAVHIEDETDSDDNACAEDIGNDDGFSDASTEEAHRCDLSRHDRDALQQRCADLEARVRELENENSQLRAFWTAQHVETAAEPPAGENQNSETNVFSPSERVAGDSDVNLRPEIASQSHCVGKVGLDKVALMVGREQRKNQRAVRKKKHNISDVQQCESIVDQLLDTIDMLKTTVAASPGNDGSSNFTDQLAKQVDSSEEDGDSYMTDLRDAVGDFFSGIGLSASGQESTPTQWQRQALPKHRKARDSTVMFV